MKHRKVTRDRDHLTIMHGLRAYGYGVADLASQGNAFPDLIAAKNNVTVLLEVKTPGAKFYISQLEFLSTWKGYAGFVTTLDEAVQMMTAPHIYCLDPDEKDKMAQIALRYRAKTKAKNPQIGVAVFERLMKEKV